jgi:hypothetical protein
MGCWSGVRGGGGGGGEGLGADGVGVGVGVVGCEGSGCGFWWRAWVKGRFLMGYRRKE